jgi:hypothetical protein
MRSKSGALQESEGEEAETSRVVLSAAAAGRAGRALVGRQSRVRLHEVGPRLELEIVKVCALHLYCCIVPSQDGGVGQLDVIMCFKPQTVQCC